MTCRAVRARLSAYRDRALPGAAAQQVEAHLRDCHACAQRWRSLTSALDALADTPRLRCPDGIAVRVLTQLEVESRGPGLALLYRPMFASRPFMIPSLVPAAFLLVMVIAGALALSSDPGPLPPVATQTLPTPATFAPPLPSWGTELLPLVATAEVSPPRARHAFPADVLTEMEEGTVFIQTVVARDGSVANVTLLDGNGQQAAPLIEALRRERYEPGRFRGRPVAVSVYRLISRMEVRAPLT